jgi:hypothetical protein
MTFKNKITLILIPLIIFFFYIFIYNFIHFEGNKFLYFLFSIFSFYLIISIFFEKKYFSEVFLSIYLWLGFWWKFSISQWYYKSDQIILSASEGFVSTTIDPKLLDETFFSLIISFLAIIVTSKIFRIFSKEDFNIETKNEIFFAEFYLRYRKNILFFYLSFFIIIGASNLYYGIFQKGLINNNDINIFVLNFYKWIILIGATMLGAIILFYEIKIKSTKVSFVAAIVIFQNFIISSSNLSRAMILDCSSILYGLNKCAQKYIKKNNLNIFKLVVIMFLFFFLSFSLSVNLRQKFFSWNYQITKNNFIEKNITIKNYEQNRDFLMQYDENIKKEIVNEEKKIFRVEERSLEYYKNLSVKTFKSVTLMLKKIFNEIFYLSINRWIGIDSMIIVSNYTERNFKIFEEAFSEKASEGDNTYYEKIFIKKFNNVENSSLPSRDISKYNERGNQIVGIITPGFISFFHYPKNNFFLFFAICAVFLIVLIFEKFFYFFSGNNLILVSFFSHLMIYRLMHFGYLPSQTYFFFGTLFLSALLLFFAKKIILKFSKK